MGRRLAVRLYWMWRNGWEYSPSVEFGSHAGQLVYRTWREIKRRAHDWASRSLKREFEEVIPVEVLIEEMYGSDGSRPLDYERALVVDAEKKENGKERKRKTLLSEKRSVLKKSLTGPTLLEMSGNPTNRELARQVPVDRRKRQDAGRTQTCARRAPASCCSSALRLASDSASIQAAATAARL
jgi:hypothetical protein